MEMLHKEFKLDSEHFSEKDVLNNLLRWCGYDYNSTTFSITKRPGKFGGTWEQSDIDKKEETQKDNCLSSLLENQKFIDFVHSPLCDKCGGI